MPFVMSQNYERQGYKWYGAKRTKGEFTQYPFFVRFFYVLFLPEKVCAFLSAFLYGHIRTK